MDDNKTDIYERITKQIVEAIEAGAEEFRMPWHATGAECWAPANAASGRAYRGVNVISLWAAAWSRGYTSGVWATYRQWQQLGAQVRKGETAAPVVFWKMPDRSREETQEAEEAEASRGILARGYSVFSVEQVDGYSAPAVPVLSENARLENAEAFFAALGAW